MRTTSTADAPFVVGGPRSGGDHCPGTMRLHEAADGPLARLRLPGGLLTSPQVEALAAVVERLGDGRLRLTARGNVELRAIRDPAALADALSAAGLLPSPTRDRVRNVVASPLAGLDGAGFARADAWVAAVRALDRELVRADGLDGVSGRFLFGLDDGRGDVAALRPDLLATLRPDGRARITLDGAPGEVVTDLPHVPTVFATMAAAFVAAVDGGSGDPRAWRLRDLPPGDPAPAAVLAAGRAAAHTPRTPTTGDPRRNTTAGAGTTPRTTPDPLTPPPAVPTPPTGTSTNTPVPEPDSHPSADPTSVRADVPGLFHGPEGAGLVALLPLGEAGAAAWRALAWLAGDGLVRTTAARGVVLAGLSPAGARAAAAECARLGLVVDPADPAVGVSACAGLGCARAHVDIRAVARAGLPARERTPLALRPLVHFSACERRCGHPVAAHDEVVATDAGLLVGRRDA